jgi:hypothetical protein
MKNNFNYSGFCKSAYSFNSKKSAYVVVGKRDNNPQDNPAWRVPPYLALPPGSRYLKGND